MTCGAKSDGKRFTKFLPQILGCLLFPTRHLLNRAVVVLNFVPNLPPLLHESGNLLHNFLPSLLLIRISFILSCKL